jgi:hypothetical protein
LFDQEPGLVTLIVVAMPRLGKLQPHSQQLRCHARYIGDRLDEDAAFDADDLGT